MSSKDNLALDLEHGVRRWDRARWISVFSSHNPTIREVTECLGLGLSASSSTTNRGIPKFDNPDYRKLSSEVTKLSKELPKERDALLDFAADPTSLDKELEELLAIYGPAIWGKDADRSCLLKPDSAKKTYNKDLFFEDLEHKEILKIHLHRWIIIKACYYIRNMKLKRPSGANEYDTLADMDADAASPHGTPQSLSPPGRVASAGAELEVKPVNFKKRKISARMSLSDGEAHSSVSPAKRPYSTLPITRTDSPRKAIKSLYSPGPGSLENIPPLPSQAHHLSPPLGPASESGRIHLSPLASNELNGVSRPPGAAQTSPLGSFIAVNSGSFTAVNTPPSIAREPVREVLPAPLRDPHHGSPTQNHRDAPTYTSPYEPASRSSTTTQIHPDPRPVPSLSTSPAAKQTFQAAIGSPIITNGPNGITNRESPIVQHAHQPHVTPQPQPQVLHQVSSQIPAPIQPPIHPHGPLSGQSQTSPSTHVLPPPHIQSHPQPPYQAPSRTNTPSIHHHHGRPLAPLGPSRSGTPLAQAATLPPPIASIAQAAPLPIVHNSPAYSTQTVPTQQAPAVTPNSYIPPPLQPQAQQTVHHQPVLKSQPSEVTQIVQAPHVASRPAAAAATATTDLRLLQFEVTAGLFTFFYPRSTSPPDEPALLQRLHTLWYHGASLFERDLGSHYDLISKILTSWLHERQAITALRHSLAAQPGVNPMGLVDRLLAMNDLRVMRLKWKNMSTVDGLSPEDLLCMAFRVMTNTEGSEYLFKDGLDRLNSGVFDFLRSEDAKIVMHRR